jgi:centrosomal protein CEP57
MDDSDIVSNFSSIADAPDHLQTQYDPLGEVFKVHPHLVPSAKPPESNSDAMIRALKALQEKIRHLEVERVSAANRLSHLERKTAQTPKHRHKDTGQSTVGAGTASVGQAARSPLTGELAQDQQDLQKRLESIDRKFSQQSRELREMRRQFEEQNSKSPPGYDTVDAPYTSPSGKRRYSTPEKSRGSSRERKARSESPVQVRMPLKRKKVRRARKPSHRKQAPPLRLCQLGGKPQVGVHYRLDMKDVPFVAGTSLSPSHSVAANYQRVVSLMKSHGPLCGAVAASTSRKLKRQRYSTTPSQRYTVPRPGVPIAELEVLLAGLEEELGELTFRHQQLALKEGSQPINTRSQLQQLEDDLEAKATQIDIVQRQIDSMRGQRTEKKASTSIRTTKSLRTNGAMVEEAAGTESRGDFLRRMKSLQNTLQSDDLTWK